MSLFEPEETVGKYWHRLIGSTSTYPRHPEAAVPLEFVRGRLGVMFRALGGSGAIRIVSGAPVESGHRLNLRQRIGLGREKLDRPVMDDTALRLPAALDVFPARADNEALYEWLAAWFANAVPPGGVADDPLQNDLLRLRAAVATTRAALERWPGLVPLYRRLSKATLDARPRRPLPNCEAALDATIEVLLGGTPARRPDPKFVAAVEGATRDVCEFSAPAGYATYLPVPVWGEVVAEAGCGSREDADEEGGDSVSVDQLRRRAIRRSNDQSQRGDPLILHRFETIFGIAEMVNVNREVEDDDEEGAREAASDLPELTIGSHHKRAATRLKLDLELTPGEIDTTPMEAQLPYPEWDWKRRLYHPSYCRVIAGPAPETGEDWEPDAQMQRHIRQVRRQFEALRPKRQIVYGEPDGHDLDLSALVRDLADRRAGGPGTERVMVSARSNARDLSLAVLMDVSLSTDAWLDGRRVLDVEKSALLALTHGLTACGDEHAIFTFTSRRRSRVDVLTVKGFDEELNPRVVRRIQALKPGQYTRMGAAVRHVNKQLADRPQRHRLMLILTDGKPNDIDHYEGRYGIEDTRMAIREAREAGIRVFGVTVDEHARDYFPYIFGRGAYAIFPSIARLPAALPAIYRQITN
jgi:nitric oxide reductase NorD protein